MVIFRLIGIWLILFGLVALAIDGTKSLAANEIIITSAGQQWFNLHPASLNGFQAAIERYVHPFVWDPIIFTMLKWPTWAILGLFGIIFYWIGRKRRKPSPFIN